MTKPTHDEITSQSDPGEPRLEEEHRPGASVSPRRIRRGRGLLVVLASLLAGVLVGVILTDGGANPETVRSSSTASSATQGPLETGPAETDRVAAVAAAVAPSVVHLESDNGLGSGVIYDPAGLILTAAHVVGDSKNIQVRLADGRIFNGRVVGTHALTDVAVVSIDAPTAFPVAELDYGGTHRVGELAVALGSPFGLDQTVTAGILSSIDRTVNGVPMVQTDAAINPGNSGGPLLDGNGRVIGINDVIFSFGGGNDGIGFAIAIDVAIVVADQIVAGDDVRLSVLGVSSIPSTTGEGGAIVRQILAGSPVDDAGLEVGDRIVTIDGEPVTDPSKLFASVVTRRPGSEVELEFIRGGQLMTARAVLVGIER